MTDRKNDQNAEIGKKVDESWKARAKEEARDTIDQGVPEMPADFIVFASGLMLEGLVSLGEVEHPVTKKKETNLVHAKFIIDMLALLEEKTKNNLTQSEADALQGILYELRMKYITRTGNVGPAA